MYICIRRKNGKLVEEISCCISLVRVAALSSQLEGEDQCERSLERGVEAGSEESGCHFLRCYSAGC